MVVKQKGTVTLKQFGYIYAIFVNGIHVTNTEVKENAEVLFEFYAELNNY